MQCARLARTPGAGLRAESDRGASALPRAISFSFPARAGQPKLTSALNAIRFSQGIASTKQLAMMARVLEAYCERFAVPHDETERDQLGLEVLALFDRGFRDEESIVAELISRRARRA